MYGRQSLLAVHCTTRYTFVIYDLNFSQWDNLADTFMDGLQASLLDLGISQQQIDRYFTEAGQVQYTKTHGRREVAFLNRAWNDVMDSDSAINPDEQYQPLLDSMVNTTTSRCAGYSGPGLAGLRMKAELMVD